MAMLLRVICFLLAFAACTPAVAERRAILVGVSGYSERGITPLKGAANDVRLMRETIMALGFTDIYVLADGPGAPAGAMPTHSNISAAFEDMIEAVRRGSGDDQVMLYLSGHGSRGRDQSGDELDGYDELFLPIDATPDRAAPAGFANVLIDDEIGVFLDAIRTEGADVWLIMDSCFSASGARAASDPRRIQSRYVDPPFETGNNMEVSVFERTEVETGEGFGGLVAFYASQAYERAWEYNFGKNEDDEAAWYGIFTAKLVSRMKSVGEVSYQQLFEGVLDDMNESGLMGNGTLQTPFLEGTDLHKSYGTGSGVWQYPMADAAVAAGTLHGITEGAVFAVYDDAAAADDKPNGHVQVVAAYAAYSSVRPVAADCLVSLDDNLCTAVPPAEAAYFETAKYARLAAPALTTVLSLSSPFLLDDRDTQVLADALHNAAAKASEGLGTPVVLDASSFNLMVAFFDGRIWFAGSEGFLPGDRPSNIAWPIDGELREASVDELAMIIHRAAKALNIMRSAEALRDSRDPLDLPVVTLEAQRSTSMVATLRQLAAVKADVDFSPSDECAQAEYGDATVLESVSTMKQCDRIEIRASANGVARGLDVNVIYVDSNFGIHVWYEYIPGPSMNLAIFKDQYCSDCPRMDGSGGTRTVYGQEALIVITAQQVAGMRPFNLSELAQDGVETARLKGATREDGFPNPALDLLFGLTFPEGSRRSHLAGLPADLKVEAEIFRWRLLPREVALSGLVTTVISQ